ncbi:NAD-dependent epimerase/dehydratase family protein [Indioceanicola profundi]|uniref:NAD-dependent epimerase/dehydratase family protein n=1 Tax=Indioceanicola profundi TaxID=2220096 RepID=UPI000E6ADE0F|nr:NAD-dependent epimerase/dehydratase family protein [Indioceanicola profundi]
MKDGTSPILDRNGDRPVLITGGAGFVGTNLASRLARQGRKVIVYDNLSRAGVERNLTWLKATHGDMVEAEVADIRDGERLAAAVARAGSVFHFAAQVAVTTSLTDPVHDFEVNALGTLRLLEVVRAQQTPPTVLFSSTNKVYGALADLELEEGPASYQPRDPVQALGVTEDRPLDFHSPYGCSKGAADQYVVDYARSYGLPAAVLRMSCIYGPHQFGTEDQGWVAHFLIAAGKGDTITLYGTGKQVRDILHVDDLVDAFLLAEERMPDLRGQAFNMGGGAENALSLRTVLNIIEELQGAAPAVSFGPWRTGDQPWYVANSARFRQATGWSPKVEARDGIGRLHRWLTSGQIAPASSAALAESR